MKGYRTYIVGCASLLFAGLGYLLGNLSGVEAFQIAEVALSAMGIRAAL